jgi:hypothetical protein
MILGIWKWKIMKKIYAKSIILFFLIFSSCLGDELLKNTRQDYMGDNLRIDGFYYNYYQGKIMEVIFLYRNGIQA